MRQPEPLPDPLAALLLAVALAVLLGHVAADPVSSVPRGSTSCAA